MEQLQHSNNSKEEAPSIPPPRITVPSSPSSSSAAAAAAPSTPRTPLTPFTRNTVSGLYACDHPGCPYEFNHLGHLNRHRVRHQPVGERKLFPCTYAGCSASFTRNDRLRRHWKIHQMKEQEGIVKTPRSRRTSIVAGPTATHAFPLAATAAAPSAASSSSSAAVAASSWIREGEDEGEGEVDMEELERQVAAEMDDSMSSSDVDFNPAHDAAAPSLPSSASTAADSSASSSSQAPPSLLDPSSLPAFTLLRCPHAGCDYTSTLKEHLKRHVAALHLKPPTPRARKTYRCKAPGCTFTADKKDKLKEHSYEHTGVLPFVCQQVILMMQPPPAASSPTLDTPMLDASSSLSFSSVASPSSSSSSLAPDSSSPPSAASPLPSRLCGCAFATRALLLKHAHLSHARRFVCAHPGCERSFARFMEMKKHQQQEHAVASKGGKQRKQKEEEEAEEEEEEDLSDDEAEEREDEDEEEYIDSEEEEKQKKKRAKTQSSSSSALKRFPCPFTHAPFACARAFQSRSALYAHIRAQHDATWRGKESWAALRATIAAAAATAAAPAPQQEASLAGENGATESSVAAAASLPSSSPASSPLPSSSPSVLRWLCPLLECSSSSDLRRRLGFAHKKTLTAHLCSFHSLPRALLVGKGDAAGVHSAAQLASAIAAADEEFRTKGAPPRIHPNAAKRKSAIQMLAGKVSTPPSKKADKEKKSKRKEETGAEGGEAASSSPGTAASPSSSPSFPALKRKREPSPPPPPAAAADSTTVAVVVAAAAAAAAPAADSSADLPSSSSATLVVSAAAADAHESSTAASSLSSATAVSVPFAPISAPSFSVVAPSPAAQHMQQEENGEQQVLAQSLQPHEQQQQPACKRLRIEA